jgi:hypothetical protein
MSGLLVDHSQKGMFNSAEYYAVLTIQTKKMILKKNKKDRDDNKQNIVIQLEKVYRMDQE